MKRSVTVLILVGLFCCATSAWAIRPHGRLHYEPSVYLTPSLGIISFSGDFESFTGFDQVSDGIVGLDLSFRVVEGLGIGFEIADVPTSRRDIYRNQVGGDVIFLNFNIFYDIPTGSSVSPFVDIGIGRMEIHDPLQPNYGYTTYLLGGGFKVRVHRHAGLQFQVRHVRPFLEADALANTQVRGGVSFIF
jgi:hypothetical protein